MSAPPPAIPPSLSTSGCEDGLGRRTLLFDREAGVILERLQLRPELAAFEGALRARIALANGFEDERVARVRGIERDRDGSLIVVSEFVSGSRVSDLLDTLAAQSADDATTPGVDTALGFLLEILPALAALHSTGGFSHGALAPGRVVLTPTGQVVLLDSIFGQTLERLQFDRRRLWTELGIGVPPAAGPSRLDIAADIDQASLIALMIVTGRMLRDHEYPDGLGGLVAEVIEIAQIRGSARFASGLQRFLERTLPFPGRQPYPTAGQAVAELRDLAKEIGIARCRTALVSFINEMDSVRDLAAAEERGTTSDESAMEPTAIEDGRPAADPLEAGAAAPSIIEADVEPLPAIPAIAAGAAPMEIAPEAELEGALEARPAPAPLASFVPETGPSVVLPVAGAALPQAVTVPVPDAVTVAVLTPAAPAEETVVVDEVAPRVEAAQVPILGFDPRIAAEPSLLEPTVAAAPVAPVAVAAPVEPAPIEDPAPPVPAAAPGSFDPESRMPAVVPTPTEHRTSPAPVAASSEPVRVPDRESRIPAEVTVDGVPTSTPIAAPATTPTPPSRRKQKRDAKKDKLRSHAAPPPPVVTAAPATLPVQSTIRVASPAPFIVPTPQAPGHKPIPLASKMFLAPAPVKAAPPPSPPIQLKVKADPPAGYAAPTPARSERTERTDRTEPDDMIALPYVQRGVAREGASSFPWKLAAAAIVIAVVGVGTARWFVPTRTADTATTIGTPDPVAAAPAVNTKGTRTKGNGGLALVSQPNGARVLVDGRPVGVTPITVEALAAGSHAVAFVTESGALVKRVVRVEAGKTATLDVPIYSGWVTVFSPVTLDISENGRGIGTTEQGHLMLPPGRHELTFTSREFAYTSKQSVDIEPGAERTLTVEPVGALNLNAVPWAEVWIDGKKVGETPMANFPVSIGTHEIVFKNAQFGERRVTSTVTAAAAVTASVDFAKSPQP